LTCLELLIDLLEVEASCIPMILKTLGLSVGPNDGLIVLAWSTSFGAELAQCLYGSSGLTWRTYGAHLRLVIHSLILAGCLASASSKSDTRLYSPLVKRT